jgi:hypothetical protein
MYVVILVVLSTAVTLFNLLLVYGVIRRLRLHTEQIAELVLTAPRSEPIIDVGSRPDEFSANTVDDVSVTTAQLAGGLVAFFSPTCGVCEEWIPRFVETASTLPGGRPSVLAVVASARASDADDLVSRLRDVAMVVVEADKGPLATAFAVRGYPAMCRLDDNGVVLTNRVPEVVAVPVVA